MRKPKEILYVRVSPEAMKKLKALQKKMGVSRSKTVDYLLLNVKTES
jgi:hypothetical protein